MIVRHPDVPYNYFELAPHKSFGDYARTYRDDIARRYEDYDIVYFPHFPLDIDLLFFQSLNVPESLPKLGTSNGIDLGLYKRDGASITTDNQHALFKIMGQTPLAGYAQYQIQKISAQIAEALRTLLPKYYSLFRGNITWRLTETKDIHLHVDYFNSGEPFSAVQNALHRIKLFINIDTEPRHWRTSYIFPEILARYRDKLPDTLPLDRNVIATAMQNLGILRDAPSHSIQWPTLSALLVNGEAVSHAVVSGRRMIAAEFLCLQHDMLNPEKLAHAQLPTWLARNGYKGVPPAITQV